MEKSYLTYKKGVTDGREGVVKVTIVVPAKSDLESVEKITDSQINDFFDDEDRFGCETYSTAYTQRNDGLRSHVLIITPKDKRKFIHFHTGISYLEEVFSAFIAGHCAATRQMIEDVCAAMGINSEYS